MMMRNKKSFRSIFQENDLKFLKKIFQSKNHSSNLDKSIELLSEKRGITCLQSSTPSPSKENWFFSSPLHVA